MHLKTPLISVIVPVYNVQDYLEQCLDSLLLQTYPNLEILCVNGGSTDQSAEILSRYADQDNRIQVIDTQNRGVSHSRNLALAQASGDYCMFVDSDDWIDPQTCEDAVSKAIETSADVVMWSYVREYKGASLPKDSFTTAETVLSGEEVQTTLHRRMIGLLGEELRHPENTDALCPIWGKLYRSSLAKAHRFIDLQEIGTYEDGMYNLELLKEAQRVCCCNWHYYHYRKTNQGSLTSRYKKDLAKQWENLFERMRRYIEDNQLGQDYCQALDNRICLSVLGLGLNILSSGQGIVQNTKDIGQILRSSRYRQAYRSLTFRYFPLHWKLFYGAAKYRCSIAVACLLKCIQKMIQK